MKKKKPLTQSYPQAFIDKLLKRGIQKLPTKFSTFTFKQPQKNHRFEMNSFNTRDEQVHVKNLPGCGQTHKLNVTLHDHTNEAEGDRNTET